jgi:hypothetical protein
MKQETESYLSNGKEIKLRNWHFPIPLFFTDACVLEALPFLSFLLCFHSMLLVHFVCVLSSALATHQRHLLA